MKALWRLSLALCFVGLFVRPASAEQGRAKQAYERGVKQYNLGEYQAALEAFTAAYDELPDPALLYNLAQCHRQLGHARKAITLYRSYLRETEGTTSNAQETNKLIAELEQQLAREQAPKTPSASAPPPPTTAQLPTPAPAIVAPPPPIVHRRQNHSTRALKIAGLSLAVVGIVGGAAGGAMFAIAKSANDEYLHPADGTYSASAEQRRATFNVLDKAFAIGGGVALATGVVLFAVGVRKSNSWSLAPAVSRDSASVALSVRF